MHLCSLGKDSVLTLEWLARCTKPKKIISLFFGFMAAHPDDERYMNYLKKRFPQVEFIIEPNAIELTLCAMGIYQSPVEVNTIYSKFEYDEFSREKQVEEIKKKYNCDYICDGSSKYESFARRTKFHQKGLLYKDFIYPLGMMSRDQVVDMIRKTGVKLHPCYKFSKSSPDHPSWYKLRALFITNERYWKNMTAIYPLLLLDKYRYERMLK